MTGRRSTSTQKYKHTCEGAETMHEEYKGTKGWLSVSQLNDTCLQDFPRMMLFLTRAGWHASCFFCCRPKHAALAAHRQIFCARADRSVSQYHQLLCVVSSMQQHHDPTGNSVWGCYLYFCSAICKGSLQPSQERNNASTRQFRL